VEYGTLGNDADYKRSNPDRKKGLKKMKSGFLQKETSRRDTSRDSVIRAGMHGVGYRFVFEARRAVTEQRI
jgi:hypothetical protein